jgi:hypothetical protein
MDGRNTVRTDLEILEMRYGEAPAGEVQMLICVKNDVRKFYFCSEDVVLSKHPEALVTAGILPAMRSGMDLHVDAALDPVFEKNLAGVQKLYGNWWSSYQRIDVRSGYEEYASSQRDQKRVGMFFSGGVDSFYTFLEHQDEVTDLIFVHGFDIRPEDCETCRRAEMSIRRVGTAFGKRVIKIKTNVRSLLVEYGDWGERAHGAAMAAVAHLLGDEFSRVYIAASHTEDNLTAWGSHPHLDPFWSSSRLEFVHDGCEVGRPEKLRRVALSDVALQNLRVCWKNRKGALNCGRCEKCIRTMIGLHIVGILNISNLFDRPLRAWRVLGVKIPHPDSAVGQLYNLEELKKEPSFRALYWALRIGFLRSRLKCWIKTWRSRNHE